MTREAWVGRGGEGATEAAHEESCQAVGKDQGAGSKPDRWLLWFIKRSIVQPMTFTIKMQIY